MGGDTWAQTGSKLAMAAERAAAMPATGKLEIQVQRNKETATATIDEM